MYMWIFCIILAFFLPCYESFSNSTCSDLKDCFKKVRLGKLDGHVIKTFYNKGYHFCFNECFRHLEICGSFNYNKFTGLCELNNKTVNSIGLTENAEFVYSLVPTAQSNDPCSPNPCPLPQMCVVLRSGAPTCVNECGSPLATHRLPHATEAYYKAAEYINYTCLTTSESGICRTNGTWAVPICVYDIICTFEETTCPGLEKENGNMGFGRKKGATLTTDTGCSQDHTTGSGYYYYLEATGKSEGDRHGMVTSMFPAGHQICVDLWYHMYGSQMGSLYIDIKNTIEEKPILVADGPQGTDWHQFTTVIPAQDTDVRIAITGYRGTGMWSDICFDDVKILIC